MSEALLGMHYCKEHQGNNSYYAKHNCDLCKALSATPANARAVAEKCAEIASQIAGGDPAYCVEAICAYAAPLPVATGGLTK